MHSSCGPVERPIPPEAVSQPPAEASHVAGGRRSRSPGRQRTAHTPLIAVDTIADLSALGAQLGGFLHRSALFSAIVAIGDVERPFVGERGLDARPGTHIGADL